ncbi:MAG: radical SAM protein [Phycisphaerae bacterium]|nr:radical SAM protein [Phycisphaerae bacterium]
MKPKVLLVNPPIYDFTAYDFWLKPYGLLRVAARLRSAAKLSLFDALDRNHPTFDPQGKIHTDAWGRGSYPNKRIVKPACFKDIPRYYRRFGISRAVFQDFLSKHGPFDAVMIQTALTYWYLGVQEVIEDVRRFCPQARIVLGGFYATACTDHAKALGADVVIGGNDLTWHGHLARVVGNRFDHGLEDRATEFQLPAWQLYPKLDVGVMTLTQGCPFRCSYCYVPQSGVGFSARPLEQCLAELEQLISLGVKNIAFYDDALLFQPDKILMPFLQTVIEKNLNVNFHTPNALHARFLTAGIAKLMVRAGFKTFYLGFESRSQDFHEQTGSGKVVSDELANAVRNLRAAGADRRHITAYEMLGHPKADVQQLELSMRFASSLGIQIMLSDFSPIPGTPDGDLCRSIVDLSEPLNHNKTAFPVRFLGTETVNYYKDLCKTLNRHIKG